MKLLIADDDRLVRFSLRSMLQELDGSLYIEDACNGRELVNKAKEMQPDIAFVDINMPVMNGIEAIEECQKTSPKTKYVVLTAYAEFEYAKRCIELRVSEYLLKPVAPDELRRVLENLRVENAQVKSVKLAQYQVEVQNRFRVLDKSGAAVEPPSAGQRGNYALFSFFLFEAGMEDGSSLMGPLLQRLGVEQETFLEESVYLAMVTEGYAAVHAVVHYPGEWLPDNVKRVAERICMDFAGGKASMHCLYTAQPDLGGIHAWIRGTAHTGMEYLFPPKHTVLYRAPLDREQWLGAILQRLVKAYNEGDKVNYDLVLREMAAQLPQGPWSEVAGSVVKNLSLVLGEPYVSGEFYAWLRQCAGHMKQQDGGNVGRIGRIQQFVEKHYMHDISIASIAEEFDLTPNYLSSLFREKTGKRIVEYLTEVRINNAKRILEQDSSVPVKELASLCGYTSPRHFTALFKKYTGMYPTEYKARLEAHVG